MMRGRLSVCFIGSDCHLLSSASEMKASVVRLVHLMLGFGRDMRLLTSKLGAIANSRNLLAAFFLLAITISVAAQSGRRSSNGQTTAPSVSGPKTVEKATAKAPKIQLLVSVEDRNLLVGVPYYLSDTVLDNCVRRFNDAAELNAAPAGHTIPTRQPAPNPLTHHTTLPH